jgi:hypothetical protein
MAGCQDDREASCSSRHWDRQCVGIQDSAERSCHQQKQPRCQPCAFILLLVPRTSTLGKKRVSNKVADTPHKRACARRCVSRARLAQRSSGYASVASPSIATTDSHDLHSASALPARLGSRMFAAHRELAGAAEAVITRVAVCPTRLRKSAAARRSQSVTEGPRVICLHDYRFICSGR